MPVLSREDGMELGCRGLRGNMDRPQMQNKYRTSGLVFVLLLLSGLSHSTTYTTNIYSSDPKIQAELISHATTFYETKVTKSQYSPTSVSVTISSKKPIAPIETITLQDLSKEIDKMVEQSTWTYVYGWAHGMEEERGQAIRLLHQIQGQDFLNKTCGGKAFDIPVSSAPAFVEMSILQTCMNAYNLAVSSINSRSFAVYTTTGGVVGP